MREVILVNRKKMCYFKIYIWGKIHLFQLHPAFQWRPNCCRSLSERRRTGPLQSGGHAGLQRGSGPAGSRGALGTPMAPGLCGHHVQRVEAGWGLGGFQASWQWALQRPLPTDPDNPGSQWAWVVSPPLAKMAQGKVLTLQLSKARKMNGRGPSMPKAS